MSLPEGITTDTLGRWRGALRFKVWDYFCYGVGRGPNPAYDPDLTALQNEELASFGDTSYIFRGMGLSIYERYVGAPGPQPDPRFDLFDQLDPTVATECMLRKTLGVCYNLTMTQAYAFYSSDAAWGGIERGGEHFLTDPPGTVMHGFREAIEARKETASMEFQATQLEGPWWRLQG